MLDRVNEYMVFTRANPAPAPPAVDWPARVEQLQAHLADERAAREKAEAKLAQVREIVGGAK